MMVLQRLLTLDEIKQGLPFPATLFPWQKFIPSLVAKTSSGTWTIT
jgi:hypothetical protein